MGVGACSELHLGYDGKVWCMNNERLARAHILGTAGGKQRGPAALPAHHVESPLVGPREIFEVQAAPPEAARHGDSIWRATVALGCRPGLKGQSAGGSMRAAKRRNTARLMAPWDGSAKGFGGHESLALHGITVAKGLLWALRVIVWLNWPVGVRDWRGWKQSWNIGRE